MDPSRLALLRHRRGLKQKQLAHMVGVPQPAISRWERAGYANCTLKRLRAVVQALGAQIVVEPTPAEED